MNTYKSPYPWFGGKSTIMPEVWERFGEVQNFIDPFFGSNAALLSNPYWTPDTSMIETVNDADGFVANFWRAVHADPEAVARHADNPVFENDLHARHIWLVNRRESIVPKLAGITIYTPLNPALWLTMRDFGPSKMAIIH